MEQYFAFLCALVLPIIATNVAWATQGRQSCDQVLVDSVGRDRLVDRTGRREKPSSEDIYLIEKQGAVEEHSVRVGQTAAHLYMDSAKAPYLFTAFPEGNTGIGLWFEAGTQPAFLQAQGQVRTVSGPHNLRGTEVDLSAGVRTLVVQDSVLGSMRFVRDRELGLKIPPEVETKEIQIVDGKLVLHRKSLNGLVDYYLELLPIGDTEIGDDGGKISLKSTSEVRFQVRTLTNETPLTPLSPKDVFKPEALQRMDSRQLQALSFLLYKEKLMAGSPRYLTKFGRDSIYTLRVLMDIMKPEAIENLLSATMSSMHPESGLVSHEQHEGDFASYERLRAGKKVLGVNDPIEDYKMVDDDFAFVAVLGEYARRYPERSDSFFAGNDKRGISRRALSEKLFAHVTRSTRAFKDNPTFENLIGLHKDETTGQWRDSDNGLGGGKYPFDVNAAFVPAALHSLRVLYSTNDGPFFDAAKAKDAADAFAVWNTKVITLFTVPKTPQEATRMAKAYFKKLKIDPSQLPPPPTKDIVFTAISIDENGQKIPVMHSDDSLLMTFGFPSAAYLETVSQRIDLPFPYGLTTPVGVLVANPVFATDKIQRIFDATKYHGRVSWKMQEDLLVHGIDRQLGRRDLGDPLRARLKASQSKVEAVLQAKASLGGTEVFSIINVNGKWIAVPFGGDAKSNSNQLWSHLNIGRHAETIGPEKK